MSDVALFVFLQFSDCQGCTGNHLKETLLATPDQLLLREKWLISQLQGGNPIRPSAWWRPLQGHVQTKDTGHTKDIQPFTQIEHTHSQTFGRVRLPNSRHIHFSCTGGSANCCATAPCQYLFQSFSNIQWKLFFMFSSSLLLTTFIHRDTFVPENLRPISDRRRHSGCQVSVLVRPRCPWRSSAHKRLIWLIWEVSDESNLPDILIYWYWYILCILMCTGGKSELRCWLRVLRT